MNALYKFLLILGSLLGGLFIIIMLARTAEKSFNQKRKKGRARQDQLINAGVIK